MQRNSQKGKSTWCRVGSGNRTTPRRCKDPPRCGLAYHTVKNIRRIYGRIAGNQLQGYVPLFLRKPVKIARMAGQERARLCYLRQPSDISCNYVSMSTHLYPLPRSHPYKRSTGPRKNYDKCPGSWLPAILP